MTAAQKTARELLDLIESQPAFVSVLDERLRVRSRFQCKNKAAAESAAASLELAEGWTTTISVDVNAALLDDTSV